MYGQKLEMHVTHSLVSLPGSSGVWELWWCLATLGGLHSHSYHAPPLLLTTKLLYLLYQAAVREESHLSLQGL